jgi:hypothetical protein
MTEQVAPLSTFYKPGWENYQHALIHTIAPLSSEQLALSLGPQQRSIGELLEHMLGARFNWFHLWMGEGDPNLDWSDDEDSDESTVNTAASLVALFEKSWHVISSCIGYLGHPFEKETPWAYITLRFLSFRWYSAIDRGEKCFSYTRANRRACAANHQGRHAKAA